MEAFFGERKLCLNEASISREKEKPKHFLPHFLFGIFKALGDKVNRLVLCDGVFLQAGLVGVEGHELGFVRQGVLEEISDIYVQNAARKAIARDSQ